MTSRELKYHKRRRRVVGMRKSLQSLARCNGEPINIQDILESFPYPTQEQIDNCKIKVTYVYDGGKILNHD